MVVILRLFHHCRILGPLTQPFFQFKVDGSEIKFDIVRTFVEFCKYLKFTNFVPIRVILDSTTKVSVQGMTYIVKKNPRQPLNYAVVKLHEFQKRYVDKQSSKKSPFDSTIDLLQETWPLGLFEGLCAQN